MSIYNMDDPRIELGTCWLAVTSADNWVNAHINPDIL